MTTERMLKPSPRHPITMEPLGQQEIIRVTGKNIADSTRAILLREASYPPAIYIPREDGDRSQLERRLRVVFPRPFGRCSLRQCRLDYEGPTRPWRQSKDHLAFYPDRAEVIP
jgi:uncharacterized protein (DUF427 family)